MNSNMNHDWRWWAALSIGAGIGLAVVMLLTSAAFAYQSIEISIDTVHKGSPGDVIFIGQAPAPVGDQCVAELTYVNGPADDPSIHPNTDILVGSITFTNVENGTFQAAALTFVSDGINTVSLRLGGDGVTSGGFTLEVTCNPPTTTTSTSVAPNPSPSSTTTATTPSVTTPTTPLPAPPTTLSPPPVGGVDTGGGGCADGACDGFSLSPLLTWIGIGAVWFGLAVLVSAAIGYSSRGDGE